MNHLAGGLLVERDVRGRQACTTQKIPDVDKDFTKVAFASGRKELELSASRAGIRTESMTDLSSAADGILLSLMLAGDEGAFTTLYRRRQGGIYRFALQMSGLHAVAEDVTQEVFLTLMREGGRYDAGRGSVAGYLLGIARNHVLRVLERSRVNVPLPGDDEPHPAGTADPMAEMARNETIKSVRLAVLALPAHYREVVVLCDLQEMDYLDVAEALGCAVGTVRSRLHRARGLLLGKLRAIRGEGPVARAALPERCTT